MYSSQKYFLTYRGYVPSQDKLNDLRGAVTNLHSELTSQVEYYYMLMEKYQ